MEVRSESIAAGTQNRSKSGYLIMKRCSSVTGSTVAEHNSSSTTSAHSKWAPSPCTRRAAQITKTAPAASAVTIATPGKLSASNSHKPIAAAIAAMGKVAEWLGGAVNSDCNVNSLHGCTKIRPFQRRAWQRDHFLCNLFERPWPQALFAGKHRHFVEVGGYRLAWLIDRCVAPQTDVDRMCGGDDWQVQRRIGDHAVVV